jgi:hypothetical protein
MHIFLVVKYQEKSQFERPRLGSEDRFQMDIEDIRCENVDRIQLAQCRMLWRIYVEHRNLSWSSIKRREFLDHVSKYNVLRKDPVAPKFAIQVNIRKVNKFSAAQEIMSCFDSKCSPP